MFLHLATAIVCAGALSGAALAQADPYGVKAAFVVNFLPWVTWPPGAWPGDRGPTICVFNDSPITPRLIALNGRATAGQRMFAVRPAPTLSDLTPCHVLFVPRSDAERLPEISTRLPPAGTLLITEDLAILPERVAINLAVADGRVAFDVSLAGADASGLQLSSKLVKLARRIVSTGAPRTGVGAEPTIGRLP